VKQLEAISDEMNVDTNRALEDRFGNWRLADSRGRHEPRAMVDRGRSRQPPEEG
jgi:hypothetical protein